MPKIEADIVLGDKGSDAEERVIEPLQERGKTVVIPPRRNRKNQREYDKELYKARHLIENFFAKLKQYRGMATRYDKRAENFPGSNLSGGCGYLADLMTRPRLLIGIGFCPDGILLQTELDTS